MFHAPTADGSVPLAQAINDAITATGRKSRGVKPDTDSYLGQLGIIRRTSAPAVLLEYGFLDNASDAKLIADPAQQRAWAEATAAGVLAYLGMAYTGSKGDTSGLTPICGTARATAAQMAAFLKQQNPDAPDYAAIYIEEGEGEGIRGDIAFAQSCLETGYWKFGGDVKADQHNYCGLGATGGGEPGCSFATPREGIRAQVQHLKAYASTEGLVRDCVDPRFKYVQRGSAPYVEWLGIPDNPQGKGWASGKGYGGKVLGILEKVMAVEVEDTATVITIAELKAMGYMKIIL